MKGTRDMALIYRRVVDQAVNAPEAVQSGTGHGIRRLWVSNIASALTGLPAGAAAAAKNSIGAAGQIATELGGPSGEALHTSANSAFVDGFTIAMGVVAGITFVGVLLVARFMRGMESSDEPEII